MCELLHRIGYEYKKPKAVPGNPDYEAQEIFAEQYEEFMLNKGNNIEVLFMDALHPEHNAMPSYGWIKRGEKRELKTNSGRGRLNLHRAINAETHDITFIESDTVDAYSTISLLSAMEQKYPYAPEIVIVQDNARYHYSKEVLYNTYYPDIGKFPEACIKFFRNFEKFNEEISRLMNSEFQLS